MLIGYFRNRSTFVCYWILLITVAASSYLQHLRNSESYITKLSFAITFTFFSSLPVRPSFSPSHFIWRFKCCLQWHPCRWQQSSNPVMPLSIDVPQKTPYSICYPWLSWHLEFQLSFVTHTFTSTQTLRWEKSKDYELRLAFSREWTQISAPPEI